MREENFNLYSSKVGEMMGSLRYYEYYEYLVI